MNRQIKEKEFIYFIWEKERKGQFKATKQQLCFLKINLFLSSLIPFLLNLFYIGITDRKLEIQSESQV